MVAVESPDKQAPDRIIVRLDPGGPIELSGLSESFAALARIYERHYRATDATSAEAPKLYVTKLTTGSVIAEIAPLWPMFGQAYTLATATTVVADFTRRITNGIRAFADLENPKPGTELPSRDDVSDLREFVKPLTGRSAASLGITHAKYSYKTREREVVAEYVFDSAELNRAAINMDNQSESIATLNLVELTASDSRIRTEVMLFFEQASRSAPKEKGRTGDKAVIPEIDENAHPTYFRKGIHDLKDQMIKGIDNPLTSAFVVDVHVQTVDGKIKGYLVTDVHKVIPAED
jgi:hypothetical protein